MKLFPLRSLLFCLATLLISVSCKKETVDIGEPSPDLTSEKQISTALADLNTVFADIQDTVRIDSVFKRTESTGISYNFSKNNIPAPYTHLLTVTYNGAGNDNTLRSGAVRCFIKGSRKAGTYKDSVLFDSTRINKRLITGYMVNIISDSVKSTIKYNSVFIGSVENENKKSLNFTATFTKVKSGFTTATTSDDILSLQGSWTGKNADSETITAQTTSALVLKDGCSKRRPISGVMDFFNNSNGINRRIKYGDGECDNTASFINSKGYRTFFTID